MFIAYISIFFIFLLLVFVFTGIFHLYSTGYFFSYIIIVVNLYNTAHGKKIKELFLVFVFTAYTNIYIYFFLLLAFVFTGVFNLYSIGYFFFPI